MRPAAAAPKIIDTGQMEIIAISMQRHRFIVQNSYAAIRQSSDDGLGQVSIAADAKFISHGMIVIAQNRINAEWRCEFGNAIGGLINILVTLVNKISGHYDDVRLFTLSRFDRVLEIGIGKLSAAVQIR